MATKMVLCRKCETVTARGAACNCPQETGPRFSIWLPEARKYVSGTGGGLAWTRDRAEADEMARESGGVVVDTDDFAKNWPAYARGERTPAPSPRENTP